ncbi:ATP-binding protein [Streptomyces acidiscabies]|uniref:histidine kinase n=1 Tax=Streptomyces acidiscabies TaxID=42234 RepID=A0ABU4MAW9_9ACTN|nr:ATP-binding protein [Streptomyces acidiscabies]MDX3024946.1 ATP-binding protein [Streptomyces acidiscabies]
MTAIPEAANMVLGATTAAGALAVTLLARSRASLVGRARSQTARTDDAEARERELREELRHLVTSRLPALGQHLVKSHYPVPGQRSPHLAGTEAGELIEGVLALFSDTVLTQRRRIDDAAWAAVRETSSHTQAVANQMQNLVDALQRKYGDNPEVLDALFALDQLNEQLMRQLQKTVVASGSWPGHVRDDTHLPDVVTGAKGRLLGWERIEIVSHLKAENIGVVGRAAEPIAVVCAELMANALEHSREDLKVEVALRQSDNGTVSVVIDDAGFGMTSEEQARGTGLVSGRDSRDLLLTELGDPPALGFPAIGRLVNDHGFRVTVDGLSPYNGVRAVLSIPPHLLVPIDTTTPASAMSPLPVAPPRRPKRPAGADAFAAHSDLPQRRRKHRPTQTMPSVPPSQTPDPEWAAGAWGDFQDGLDSAHFAPDTKDTT